MAAGSPRSGQLQMKDGALNWEPGPGVLALALPSHHREGGMLCKAPAAPTTVKSKNHVRVSFGRDSCLKAGTLMVADVCFRGNGAQNLRMSL